MSSTLYDDMAGLSLAKYGDRITDELNDQLEYVYSNTPFYREKFNDEGINIDDVNNASDWTKLPFTTKDEVRKSQEQAPPFGRHQACNSVEIKRVHTSSGTTGRPTYIGLTKSDFQLWKSVSQRTANVTGVHSTDTVISIFSSGPFVAATTNYAYQEFGCTFAPVGPGQTDRIIQMLNNGCGSVLLATISYVEYFLEQVRERDIDPATLGISRIVVGGEPGGGEEAIRQRIEEAFDSVLVELMGNGDMCISIWGECDHQNGMHFNGQGAVYPELINHQSGERIAWELGAEGELVYTSLNRECLPLIRFRTNDHVVVTETDCPCGRKTACIRCVGRYDNMFIVRGVNVFPTAVRDAVGEIDGTNGRIRIMLDDPDSTEVAAPVDIEVEVLTERTDDASLADYVEETIRNRLQFQANVELLPPGSLEHSEYKSDLVVFQSNS